MPNTIDLFRSAMIAVRDVMRVKSGEEVLILTDSSQSPHIGEALLSAVRTVGADGAFVVFPIRDPKEPPRSIAEAMKTADAVFEYTSTSMTYTDAVLYARQAGTRVMTMPMLTEEMFIRTVPVDLGRVRELTNRVADLLTTAKAARITSPQGTDLSIDIDGCVCQAVDGVCEGKGDFDQIPFGLTFLVSNNANGTIIVDGSISRVGYANPPVTVKVKENTIADIQGGPVADGFRARLEARNDPKVYNCPAEWGLGTNPKARFVGEDPTIEGERVYGWIHIGVGDNHTVKGGKVHTTLHEDLILRQTRTELDGRPIVEYGRYLI